jgi:hypothetical protein
LQMLYGQNTVEQLLVWHAISLFILSVSFCLSGGGASNRRPIRPHDFSL